MLFCRAKRQVPSLFAPAPAPADRPTEGKKGERQAGGFLGRAFRACAQRRAGRRRRGLQVASAERLGSAGDDDPAAAADPEKQWLVESEASDGGALDPEGWGLVRAAASPAHYA